MINLLYKEFKLNIHLVFYLFLPIIFGTLFFIPQWVFMLVFMYFFFVTVPNICTRSNAHNDISFTAILPVRKSDIVTSKIISFVIIELIHLFFGAIFAFIHVKLFGTKNFLMDVNLVLFGAVLIMFGIFNLCFFPGYFKTAYYFGKPLILALSVSTIFAGIIELSSYIFPILQGFFEGVDASAKLFRILFFLTSILLFVFINLLTINISSKNFEAADL